MNLTTDLLRPVQNVSLIYMHRVCRQGWPQKNEDAPLLLNATSPVGSRRHHRNDGRFFVVCNSPYMRAFQKNSRVSGVVGICAAVRKWLKAFVYKMDIPSFH